MSKLDQIQKLVEELKLDDSLLFLNYVLSVSRCERKDSRIQSIIASRPGGVLPFTVHFIAKQLLLSASNLCVNSLDPDKYLKLQDLYFALDDPIVHDPNWKYADPSGFFERFLGLQLPSQRRMPLQKYGLALGLFRDTKVPYSPYSFDLRVDLEAELGCTIEEFMSLGFLTLGCERASYKGIRYQGTFDYLYLADAFAQGLKFSNPQVWDSFLPRCSISVSEYRRLTKEMRSGLRSAYPQFEFNQLTRFPIVDVGSNRFLIVDPQQVVDRSTFGLFYDLETKYKADFTIRFGYAFDHFIGALLCNVCDPGKAVSVSKWEAASPIPSKENGKRGDWIYKGADHTVFIECKSLRPTLELLQFGTDESIDKIAKRIIGALEQLVVHCESITAGKYRSMGVSVKSPVCIVLTYGRIQTINGPFFRKRIEKGLLDKGITPLPYAVLSLEEFDMVVRLVELGMEFDQTIAHLAKEEPSFDALAKYKDVLNQNAISSMTMKCGEDFMNRITNGLEIR